MRRIDVKRVILLLSFLTSASLISAEDQIGLKQKKVSLKKNHASLNVHFPLYRNFGIGIHSDPSFKPFASITLGRHIGSFFIEGEGLYLNFPSFNIENDEAENLTTSKFGTVGALINGGFELFETEKFTLNIKLGLGLGSNKLGDIKDINQFTHYWGKSNIAPLFQIGTGFSYNFVNNFSLDMNIRYLYLHKFNLEMNYTNSEESIENVSVVSISTGLTWKF